MKPIQRSLARRFLAASLVGAQCVSASAAIQSVEFSSTHVPPALRWIYGIGEMPKGKGVEAALAKAKKDQLEQKWRECAADARTARARAITLAPWISILELNCALEMNSAKGGETQLRLAIDAVRKKPEWLLRGAHASALKSSFTKALLALLEQDSTSNRSKIWDDLDVAQESAALMDAHTRARMWAYAGEAAFHQQKTEAARDFYHRSLGEAENDEARSRLKALEASVGNGRGGASSTSANAHAAAGVAVPGGTLGATSRADSKVDGKNDSGASLSATPSASPSSTPGATSSGAARSGHGGALASLSVINNPNLEASAAELELVDRATTSLKTGDFVSAAQDCAKIIRDYPGGTRAKWATDRMYEIYSNLAEKPEARYLLLKQEIIAQMQKTDSDRMAEWARLMYNRGQWEDSLALARKALDTTQGARGIKTLEIAGDAALASDSFSIAHDIYDTLIEKYAGTPSARSALFHSGLLHYREQKYPQAVAEFERLLALPQVETLELSARYWLWRALQKNKSERADSVADELMRKFPFSYYGLRARLDRNGGVLEWKGEAAAPESAPASKNFKAATTKDVATEPEIVTHQWFTARDQATWARVQLLMKAGWLEEAQAELRDLPATYKADDKAVRALLWAASGQYLQASKLVNEAWDESPDLRRAPFTRAAFPEEFAAFISKEAQGRKVEPVIVQSLIKQESAYNVKAVSSSNALGLMQMIPPTAHEIATDLHLGKIVLPDDLFQPQRNITMGTYYLARLIARYQGNVPLGLASYNAGPARVDRWLKARPTLKSVISTRSSNPDDEIWFDEIPYGETSYYVKAILRNILLYRVLDQGKVEAGQAVWIFGSGS